MLASNYERVHANAHLLAKFEMLNHPYIQESIQQWGRLRLRDISVAFFATLPVQGPQQSDAQRFPFGGQAASC